MLFGSMRFTLRRLTLMPCIPPLTILRMNFGFCLKKLLNLPLKKFMLDLLNRILNLTLLYLIGYCLIPSFNLILSFIDKQLVCPWDLQWRRLWLTYFWRVLNIMFSNMGFLNTLI